MKIFSALLTMFVLLSGQTALSQCSDGQDEICIFWSTDCIECDNCGFSAGSPVTAHIVLINASDTSGVLGFDFVLINGDGPPFPPPGVNVLGYNLPPGAVNVAAPPEFYVFLLEEPLPWSPCITLMTVDLWPETQDPWCIGLVPPHTQVPISMEYFTEGWQQIPMYPCTGDDGFNIACLNDPECPPPVSVEETSWGAVKGLYR